MKTVVSKKKAEKQKRYAAIQSEYKELKLNPENKPLAIVEHLASTHGVSANTVYRVLRSKPCA